MVELSIRCSEPEILSNFHSAQYGKTTAKLVALGVHGRI
jgi:hypothetical protein